MNKTEREAVRTLEPYGFKLQGVDGGGHLVFRTDDGVAIRLSQNKNNVEHLRRRAGQTLKAQNQASRQFINWLRDKYEVGAYDRKEVRIHRMREAEEFAKTWPGQIDPRTLGGKMERSDFVEVIKRPTVGGDSRNPDKGFGVFALLGDLYGVTNVENGTPTATAEPPTEPVVPDIERKPACDVTITLPSGLIAVCSRHPGHEGEHQDKYRKVSWAQSRREELDMPAPMAPAPVVTEAVSEAPPAAVEAAKPRSEAIQALFAQLGELLIAPDEAAQTKLTLVQESLADVQERLRALDGDIDQLRDLLNAE